MNTTTRAFSINANMHGVSFGPHNSINPNFQVVKCVFKKAHRNVFNRSARNVCTRRNESRNETPTNFNLFYVLRVYVFEISAYLSHKYYRLSFLLLCVVPRAFIILHTRERTAAQVRKKKKRPDTNMCHTTAE